MLTKEEIETGQLIHAFVLNIVRGLEDTPSLKENDVFFRLPKRIDWGSSLLYYSVRSRIASFPIRWLLYAGTDARTLSQELRLEIAAEKEKQND